MAKKIKLSEAAKDLNIPAQELIGYFTEKGDTKKKAASTLTEEEMNEILEHYTKLHEVKNLDEYFATANEPRPEKKKTAAEAASEAQEKKPAAKKNEKAEKPAAKADKKDAAPKKTAPEKPVAKKETAPAAKPAVKEEKPAVRTEAPAPKAEAAKSLPKLLRAANPRSTTARRMRRSSRQRLMTEESVQSSTLHSVLKLLRPRVSAGLLTQEAATLTSTSTTSATTRWLLQTSTTATTILPRNRR